MQQYLDLIKHIQDFGRYKDDRTKTGTLSYFGYQLRFDLSRGFPLVTAKFVPFKAIVHELLWFLSGNTNIKYLNDNGVTIWDEWGFPKHATRLVTYAELVEFICTHDQTKVLGDFTAYGFSQDESIVEIPFNEVSTDSVFYANAMHDARLLANALDIDFLVDRPIELTVEQRVDYAAQIMKIDYRAVLSDYINGIDNSLEAALDHHQVPKWMPHPLAGELGPVYGAMWRTWPAPGRSGKPQLQLRYEYLCATQPEMAEALTKLVQSDPDNVDTILRHHGAPDQVTEVVDQIQELIHNLKTNPFSRRHLVSAWNPTVLPDETKSHAENVANGRQVLPPCHTLFQFYVDNARPHERMKYYLNHMRKEGDPEAISIEMLDELKVPKLRLSCQLYQRSADTLLGIPFNIASYALLTMMVAQVCDMIPADFVHTLGDCHLYSNHEEQVEQLLTREPKALPTVTLNPNVKDIFAFTIDDFELCNYQHHPAIKAPVAV